MMAENRQGQVVAELLARGIDLRDRGRVDEAVGELAVAYQLAPAQAASDYARALLLQGAEYESRGDLAGALKTYRLGEQVTPDDGLRVELAEMVRELEQRINPPPANAARAPRSRKRMLAVGAPVVVILSLLAGGLWATRDDGNGADSPSPIAAASAPATPIPTPSGNGLIVSGPAQTQTAEAVVTATFEAGRTATSTARRERAATGRELAEQAAIQGSRIAGPLSGEVAHEADGAWEGQVAGVSVSDARVDVTFVNAPEGIANPEWDAGLVFRYADEAGHFRFAIASDGRWRFYTGSSLSDDGPLVLLNVAPGSENKLQLILAGDVGYVFLNDRYVTMLDLSSRLDGGTLWVATDLLLSSESGGHPMTFRDFAVWSLQP